MGIFSDDFSNVDVTAVFPDSNSLGRIVNGEQNKMFLKFVNRATSNFTITSAAASYHNLNKNWATLRNSSALKYNIPLLAGSNLTVPFQAFSEFKPQPLGLTVWANLKDVAGESHRFVAFNSTVEVVEPVGGYFDIPLIIMYLIVASVLGFGAYTAFNLLRSQFFPPAKITTKRTTKVRAVVTPAEKGKAYPASVQPYEEEWIPEGLRARTGRKAEKSGGETSGGEGLTSGGEATSGAEGKKVRKGAKKGGKK